MAYSHPYCIKLGVKVKHKRCISVNFCRLGVYPGRLFVFGETKRSTEVDLFVVPQLALRLSFQVTIANTLARTALIFGEIETVGVRRSQLKIE